MSTTAYIEVPTWENGKWSTTIFDTREEYKHFVINLFKEPGKYEFDKTSLMFNEQARIFRDRKFYCAAPYKSKDFINYWDDQKNKCRKGVIFKSGDKTWYLTREYYMWLNFLQINDKEQKKFDFPAVRDVQYHMALYELLAELHYVHSAILKKRQIASSYFHCAKLINLLWFEETPVMKMGAAHKDQVNEKGSWRFLSEYRNFLNKHTAWYRPMFPDKPLMWQQQVEVVTNGRKDYVGSKGIIQGMSFEKDPTNGVGGPCTIFFHEEAGIAPKMDQTVEFLFPALKSGHITTGIFIAAGSVGDLEQCEPLKQMILYPEANSIYPVETDLLDDKGTLGTSGLFIPEQWSMPPYIDEFGNSLVEQALAAITEERIKWKKDLSPEKYQIRISQHPTNIAEAFAYRKISPFPLHLIAAQKKRIEEKEYPYELLDISYDAEGKPSVKPSGRIPISEFPISKKTEDKRGVLQVWERPDKGAEWGSYYASIDPVGEGKTTTSESLCSIQVIKNAVEVTRIGTNGKAEVFVEEEKIVATWCGRYDDINKTHELLELIIEWYNAWTIVENNVSLFIQHMIARRKQKYLVPKDQIMFLKDLRANQNVFQDYGWKNVGPIFKAHLLSYGIEFMKEEIDQEVKEDGTIVKTIYGIERIPDLMILKEAESYVDGLNVDRLVSYCALVAFVRMQRGNRGYRKRLENLTDKTLEKSEDLFKLKHSPFRHLGKSTGQSSGKKPPRRPYRNLR